MRTAEFVLRLFQERRILEPPIDAVPAEGLKLRDWLVVSKLGLRVADDGRPRLWTGREIGPSSLRREQLEPRRSDSNRSKHLKSHNPCIPNAKLWYFSFSSSRKQSVYIVLENRPDIVRDPDKVQNLFTKGTRTELLDSNLAKLGISLPTCLDTIRLFELDVYYFRIRVGDGNRDLCRRFGEKSGQRPGGRVDEENWGRKRNRVR